MFLAWFDSRIEEPSGADTGGGGYYYYPEPTREREGYTPFNKINVGFLWVCPVIDHEFRHNVVKVAVDPRGDSQVDPLAEWIEAAAEWTINYRINYKFTCLSAY